MLGPERGGTAERGLLIGALSAARDLGRLREIASVLVSHGMGDAVRRLGLARALGRTGRALHWKGVDERAQKLAREPEVRLRAALERLGPTFVKLGQILAGRHDLLPPHWCDELARLHEDAEPVPQDELLAQLREDLGADPEEVFAAFDREPLAAASIAQVHRARLADGTEVVLKVRRPGVRAKVDADLRLLKRMAEQADESLTELRRFRPRSLIRHFARSLDDELDLRAEARNAERLRAALADDPRVVVPRIHDRWTCERLCVMDYLEGPSVGEWLAAGRARATERSRVAAVGADVVLRTIFVDGFFHADPHPGNVVVLPDGRLGLLDFGMMGRLSEGRRGEFLELLMAVVLRRTDDAVDVLLRWSDTAVDADMLAQDCAAFIDRYHGLALREIDATRLLGDLMSLLRENDLYLPNDLALLLKVFLTLDSLGRRLDEDFVMAAHVEPFARSAWLERHSPAGTLRRGASELRSVLAALPRDLRRLGHWARRGRLHVDVDVERLERFGQRIERSSNRVTVGLVTSALIVGTAISLTIPGGPRILGLPLFGFLGFASSFAVGLWLLWAILRSGRR